MRNIMFAVIVAAGAAIAAPASAVSPDESTSSGSEAQSREDYLNEVVCRREVQVGSRVQRRRTCMTRREQIRMQNETRGNMSNYLDRANSTPPPPQ